eukprot:3553656-Ditylum_brightwellii.AAC.1
MDWANREGNTFGEGEENRAKEAEVAFLHAFQTCDNIIRKEVLSSSHPLTMQAKEFYNKARILAIKTTLQDRNDRQSSSSPCENASSNDSVANTRILTLPTFAKDQVSKVEETTVQHDDKPLSTSKTLDNQHDVSRAFSNQVGNFIHHRQVTHHKEDLQSTEPHRQGTQYEQELHLSSQNFHSSLSEFNNNTLNLPDEKANSMPYSKTSHDRETASSS